MSGRVKIKSKVVKATLANRDVLDMFHGVLGTSEGGATLSITHPKYLRIMHHVERFLKLLTVLHESNLMQLFPGPREHLGLYVGALRGQFAASFNAPDLEPYLHPRNEEKGPADGDGNKVALETVEDYSRIAPEVMGQFGEAFAAAKKCSLVNTVIVSCKNLVSHKKSLQDQAALKDRFLVRGGGLTFAPLPDLPQVNFKQIYIDDRLTPGDKEFVLVVLHKMYVIGHDVYEAVSSPDVDVNEFVEVIMSSIGEVRKHIPRCDQAFNKIVESVDLLKGNFGGYYKEYVASNNPTIIMENFVLDVSKNTKSSPAVTAQFRRIITHYRKLASQQATHPKLQSLFQQVDANFQELESKSKEADEKGDSDSEDSDEDSPAEGQAPAPAEATPAPTAAQAEAAPAEPKGTNRNTARNRRKKAARARARAGKPKPREPPETEPRRQPDERDEGLADEFDRADVCPTVDEQEPEPEPETQALGTSRDNGSSDGDEPDTASL